jgi:spermidine/putrescine-binding protein
MLNKLDKSKLKNFNNINPTYLNKAYDPNNEYSVPYMGAGVLIAVDTDVIKDDIKTYQDLLSPAYKGQMVVIEDSRAMVGMALMANGYDINDTSDAGLAKAKDFLMKLKPNIKVFDGTSPKTEMINGECPIGLIYGAECALAMQQKPSIKAIYPEGGIYFGADNMVTFAGGKNTDNALKFIDYILDGTVSASITNTFPYTNPNLAAVKLLPDSYKNNPAMNVPDDVIARSETTLDLGDASTKIDELWQAAPGTMPGAGFFQRNRGWCLWQ